MGTLVRFPQERVDWMHLEHGRNAIVLVLPVVRVERAPTFGETFEAMKASFDELHEVLHDRHIPDL